MKTLLRAFRANPETALKTRNSLLDSRFEMCLKTVTGLTEMTQAFGGVPREIHPHTAQLARSYESTIWGWLSKAWIFSVTILGRSLASVHENHVNANSLKNQRSPCGFRYSYNCAKNEAISRQKIVRCTGSRCSPNLQRVATLLTPGQKYFGFYRTASWQLVVIER